MNEELHWYDLRSPRPPDTPWPPGIGTETLPGEVSWTDDDLQCSHFSGDSEASVVDQTLPRLKKRKLTDQFGHVATLT